MADSFNFGLSDLSMEDKFAYKQIMKPKKVSKIPLPSSKSGTNNSPDKKKD